MTAGMREVAAAAGVSVGTVSNVLNKPERVSQDTRTRVLQAMQRLGFVRNEPARALRAGRSLTVGVLLLDLANPFFAEMSRGVEEVADARDAVVTLFNSASDADRESRHLAQLEEQLVLGAIVAPTHGTPPGLDALVERGTPVVVIDHAAEGYERCSVTVNDVLGGSLAARHLLERGHRGQAFVGATDGVLAVQHRHDGWRSILEAAGAPAPLLFGTGGMTADDGRAAAARLAALPPARRPTACFCGNDVVALGLLAGLAEAGLRVPADVAVVGYDDIGLAAAAAVPLTSVRLPVEMLGRAAAELLFEEIERPHEHWHRTVAFQPRLVVRASSTRAPGV